MNDEFNKFADTSWNNFQSAQTSATYNNAKAELEKMKTVFNPLYCQYRLPCGYCERLERECLKPVTQPYTVTLSNSQ